MDGGNIDNSTGENAQEEDSIKSSFDDLPIIWVIGNFLIV
jgi:hypothetical protein